MIETVKMEAEMMKAERMKALIIKPKDKEEKEV
jgi:hypothetical protein